MREILFRGMMPVINTWITGHHFYSEKENKHYITGESKDYGFQKGEVIPETVGQFTGLTDKNGKRIFEGDILHCDPFTKLFWISFGKSEKWGACFCVQSSNSIYFLSKLWTASSEIIGNIYDSPELLK